MSKENEKPLPNLSFYEAMGLEREKYNRLTFFLNQAYERSVDLIDEFVLDVKIFSVDFPEKSKKQQVKLPGFNKPILLDTFERVMDQVLLADAVMEDTDAIWPRRFTNVDPRGEKQRIDHEIVEFPTDFLGDERLIITKEKYTLMKRHSGWEDFRKDKTISLSYTVSVMEEEMMVDPSDFNN